MKTLVLLCALSTAAPACENTPLRSLSQLPCRLLAALQADKAPAKQPVPTSPAQPTKKPAPKDRDARPTPPGHLFM